MTVEVQTIVPCPAIEQLPITPDSTPVILEEYNVDLLPLYDYVTEEYLISGNSEGHDFCTRLLLRRPREDTKFSGFVLTETSHIWAGTSVWRAASRWIMRNNHGWLEIDSQAPVAIGNVKGAKPGRYARMSFPASLLAKDFLETIPFTPNPTRQTLEDEYSRFMLKWWEATPQSPFILASASAALRSGKMSLTASRVFLAGISQTGGVTRRFLTHSSHLRLSDGRPPFEALVPCASGGPALPDPPSGVKVIELLGEAEFQSVRWPCGVSGQTRGLTHRRPDSKSFRLYEVAGMAHRESRYWSEMDKERFSRCDIGGAKWSSFPNSFIYHVIFENLLAWTGSKAVPPPPGQILDTLGDNDEMARDEHGNALGGVRTVYTDAPTSRLVSATPQGRPSWYCGTEWPFEPKKLKSLYGSIEGYREISGKAINASIRDRWLLPADAETLRRETIEKVAF